MRYIFFFTTQYAGVDLGRKVVGRENRNQSSIDGTKGVVHAERKP